MKNIVKPKKIDRNQIQKRFSTLFCYQKSDRFLSKSSGLNQSFFSSQIFKKLKKKKFIKKKLQKIMEI